MCRTGVANPVRQSESKGFGRGCKPRRQKDTQCTILNFKIKMFQTIIESLLEEKIGLSANTVGSETIAKAVHHRMRRCGFLIENAGSFSAYLTHLRSSKEEWDKLVEEVIVPETWFFRNKESFSFLGGYVRFEWLANYKDRVLRVLSIPCSTGEEAYSIAMTLMDMGLPEQIRSSRFHIDAVDISGKSLHKAKAGVYGRESFRGEELSFQDRYFEEASYAEGGGKENKNRFKIYSSVRNMVRFIKGNLLDNQLLAGEKPYDIIFCRNLLIYLSESAKKRAMDVFVRLLSQNGLLFVGHVERPLVCSSSQKMCFVWIRQSGVFACRRADFNQETDNSRNSVYDQISQNPVRRALTVKVPEISRERETAPSVTETDISKSGKSGLYQPAGEKKLARAAAISFPETVAPALFEGTGSRASFQSSGLETLLDTARQLADQGYLNKALELCGKYLNDDPFHAQAHFLMGLLWNALDDEDRAEEYFNKTIYLDPNHREALSLMAFIMEHRGDHNKAEHLRQRAQRILQKEDR